jgi:hypothetical protein
MSNMGMNDNCKWCNSSKDPGNQQYIVYDAFVPWSCCSKQCMEQYNANKKSKKKTKKSGGGGGGSGNGNGFVVNAIAVLVMISLALSALKAIYGFLVIDTTSGLITWSIITTLSVLYIKHVQHSFKFTRTSAPFYIILTIWLILIARYVKW